MNKESGLYSSMINFLSFGKIGIVYVRLLSIFYLICKTKNLILKTQFK